MAEKFGILGDILGVNEDVPSIKLRGAFAVGTSDKVTYHHGCVRRMPGRGWEFKDTDGDPVQIPDANPIMRWHYHIDPAGAESVFAFTKAHAYLWNDSAHRWDLLFTCSSDCTSWSTENFKTKVIATNNLDLIQQWEETTPGTAFVPMDDPATGINLGDGHHLTRAKYVIAYESYLFFMDTYEDGVRYRYRRRWSSRGDETDFDETGSGDTGSNDLNPTLWITGCAIYSASTASMLITFTNRSINTMVLVEDAIVFQSNNILDAGQQSIGCLAPDSVVNDQFGNIYYLATDYTIRRVLSEEKLSAGIDKTIKNINRTLVNGIRATYMPTLDQLWWAIPKDAASTGNDKIVRFNLDTGGWEPTLDYEISAFGRYGRQSTPHIDDIDQIIDECHLLIDGAEETQGWSYDIGSDYDGYAFSLAIETLDLGVEFSAQLVMATDLAGGSAVNVYKRTTGASMWFENLHDPNKLVTIAVREVEQTTTFTSAGTVPLDGDGDLIEVWVPFDVRAKQFELAISGSCPWAFAGCVFDFTYDGE